MKTPQPLPAQEPPPAAETLADRVRQRLEALGLSQRKAARLAGLSEDTVRTILRRHTDARAETLARLAPVLGVSVDWLARGLVSEPTDSPPAPALLPLRGRAAAGLWLEGELDASPEVVLPLAVHPRWPAAAQWGLTLEGDSLDQLYPAGAAVHVVALEAFGRSPRAGDLVVLVRRRGQLLERSVKELRVDGQGRLQAWPRSTNPRWQTPVDFAQDLDDGDTVTVEGVVVGAYFARL